MINLFYSLIHFNKVLLKTFRATYRSVEPWTELGWKIETNNEKVGNNNNQTIWKYIKSLSLFVILLAWSFHIFYALLFFFFCLLLWHFSVRKIIFRVPKCPIWFARWKIYFSHFWAFREIIEIKKSWHLSLIIIGLISSDSVVYVSTKHSQDNQSLYSL